jgi:hypothetical protein
LTTISWIYKIDLKIKKMLSNKGFKKNFIELLVYITTQSHNYKSIEYSLFFYIFKFWNPNQFYTICKIIQNYWNITCYSSQHYI